MSEASLLKELQQTDLEILRISKKLKEIPEREKLAKVEAKLEEIQQKSRQISALRSNCEVEMQKLDDEDAQLSKRAKDLQAEIDSNSDFRVVDSLTRDLEGVAKRRNKVEFAHEQLIERSDKISALEDQAASGISKLEAQQSKLQEQISSSEKSVSSQVEELKAKHVEIASKISKELLEEYAKLAKAKGGIGVGTLQGTHCSACRVEFPEGKLLHINSGPEITKCPQCHRLLIVEKG